MVKTYISKKLKTAKGEPYVMKNSFFFDKIVPKQGIYFSTQMILLSKMNTDCMDAIYYLTNTSKKCFKSTLLQLNGSTLRIADLHFCPKLMVGMQSLTTV